MPRMAVGQERFDLRVSAGMAAAQDFPLRLGQVVGILAHPGPGLRGEITGGAHQHHGFHAVRLFGCEVQ